MVQDLGFIRVTPSSNRCGFAGKRPAPSMLGLFQTPGHSGGEAGRVSLVSQPIGWLLCDISRYPSPDLLALLPPSGLLSVSGGLSLHTSQTCKALEEGRSRQREQPNPSLPELSELE